MNQIGNGAHMPRMHSENMIVRTDSATTVIVVKSAAKLLFVFRPELQQKKKNRFFNYTITLVVLPLLDV